MPVTSVLGNTNLDLPKVLQPLPIVAAPLLSYVNGLCAPRGCRAKKSKYVKYKNDYNFKTKLASANLVTFLESSSPKYITKWLITFRKWKKLHFFTILVFAVWLLLEQLLWTNSKPFTTPKSVQFWHQNKELAHSFRLMFILWSSNNNSGL